MENARATAVAHFSDSARTTENIMRCGLDPGKVASEREQKEDTARIRPTQSRSERRMKEKPMFL